MPSPRNPETDPARDEHLVSRMEALTPAQRALLNSRLASRRLVHQQSTKSACAPQSTTFEPIAIVGMGCRFPGAGGVQQYWELISQGRESISSIANRRWDRERFYDPTGRAPGKMSVDAFGLLENVDRFDPGLFGISPREASRMDPQQRVLLEVVWETFEHAGIAIEQMAGTNTGVFIGIGGTDYSKIPSQFPDYYETIDAHMGTGNALSVAAGRVSYLFDLHGPSFIVDTACSSALVAIHEAAMALRLGECDAAIAGGVNLILSPETTIAFSKARMLSMRGRCQPFDEAADGYVRGEGCGIVLLKRLTDARQDGNRVLGLLHGSAVNQDGRTSGITAPSSEAQRRVIERAMQIAGVGPDDLTYIEAHGTGTPLGDPIELAALAQTFANRSADVPPLRIGSVKGNIGHTETASGIAGLLKVLQMFAHRRIPAQANFQRLNSNVNLPENQLAIASHSQDWHPNADGRWIAGVSSFGFGGTNAHLIVEAPRTAGATDCQSIKSRSLARTLPPSVIFPLSAHSPEALSELAARYHDHLQASDAVRLHDVSVAAATHRSEMTLRAAVVSGDGVQTGAALLALANQQPHPDLVTGRIAAGRRSRIAMLFTGQGSQYTGMAMRLQATWPEFRRWLDRCEETLQDVLPRPLRELLAGSSQYPIDHTSLAQPAICAVQCALVATLRELGVRPDVVAGHSIGEIAALYAAGTLNLRQALLLAAYRGQVMGQLPAGGTMLALLTDADTVSRWLDQEKSPAVIATYNGAGNTVVAGPSQAIDRLQRLAGEHDVACRQLAVSHAFHSPLMADAVAPLRERIETLIDAEEIPIHVTFVSAVTGQPYAGPVSAEYWLRHLVQPVRFSEVMASLHQLNLDLAIEVGPSPQLCGMIRRTSRAVESATPFATVATLDRKHDDDRMFRRAIATAWSAGAKIDWAAVHRHYPANRVELPTYPFQRQRLWYDPPGIGSHGSAGDFAHPWLGHRQSLATGGTLYQGTIRAGDPNYLADHVIAGSITVPAAAWIEAIRAAASHEFADTSFELQDLKIHRALFLEAGEAIAVQTNVQGVRGGRSHIQIDTRAGQTDAHWQTRATAVALKSPSGANTVPSLPMPIDGHPIDAEDFYQRMASLDLAYGEYFQVLGEILSDGHVASASLQLAAELADANDDARIHPAVLDGALQLIATVAPTAALESKATFLPVGCRRLTFAVGGPIKSVRVRRGQYDHQGIELNEFDADVELIDDRGSTVARLEGMRLQRLQRATQSMPDPTDWIHRVNWTAVNPADVGIDPDVQYGQSASQLRLLGCDDLSSHIAPPLTDDSEPARHWVWTCPSQSVDRVASVTADLMATVQSALAREPQPALSIITRNGAAITRDQPVDPVASAAIAFARVAQNEHPELAIQILDVDQFDAHSTAWINSWLDRRSDESEQAIRGQRCLVPRLIASPDILTDGDADGELDLPGDGSYRIRLDGTNRTEGLWAQRIAAPSAIDDEVAIQINAVGLNFSDVLKSMGLYPGIRDKIVPMGIEVCGRVTGIGERVKRFQVGQRVMGVVRYGFASHEKTKEYLLCPAPPGLSDQEAASIPIVFATAHHALLRVGNLTQHESVLIHAGAGGVGMAAIQVAQHVGANIFATAGSETKRRLLAQLGIPSEQIFDSRDIQSIDKIRAATSGRGIDVVLNSLPGEWIDASLGLLAPHGRFLEIGKTDIYQNRAIGLLPFQDNLTYSAIDLDRLLREKPDQVRALLDEVYDRFASDIYSPTPITSFRLAELPAAMRFMAARRNLGKIVVSPPAGQPDVVRSKGVYLITGGSGAIAQGTARRLIQRGARHVVLVARSEPGQDIKDLMADASEQGASCRYLRGDCGDESSLRPVIAALEHGGDRIVGVIHAAGVLDDCLIHEMSGDSIEQVMHAKVGGAIALDRLTKNHPLEMFVLLGSVATVLGSPGQANYAAANAFLEGFAAERRRRGQPVALVHWGPWATAGMAADPVRLKNLTARGLRPLDSDAAIDLLIDTGGKSGGRDAVIIDADFGRMLASGGSVNVPSVLRSFHATHVDSWESTTASKDTALLAELHALDDLQLRAGRLAVFFADQLGRIMNLEPDSIDAAQPLSSLGLDSLMALELKNTIEARLDISIPISQFMGDPTLESLSESAAGIVSREDCVASG